MRAAGRGGAVRFAPGARRGGAGGGRVPGRRHGGRSSTCEADDPAALNAALDKARAAGALLVELKRDGQDLEAVLASRRVGAAA